MHDSSSKIELIIALSVLDRSAFRIIPRLPHSLYWGFPTEIRMLIGIGFFLLTPFSVSPFAFFWFFFFFSFFFSFSSSFFKKKKSGDFTGR